MRPRSRLKRPATIKCRHWAIINNGCVRGVRRREVTIVRRPDQHSIVQDTVAVFTLGKPVALLIVVALAVLVFALLPGCQMVKPQKGGHATSLIAAPGRTNLATVAQPENPQESSRQTVQSRRTVEYLLPAGTAISLGDAQPTLPQTSPSPIPAPVAVLHEPVPIRVTANDRTETAIGAAQKDTARELVAKAASLQPVMWAGIAMATVVAGVLAYFGWWTKAALAFAIGTAMIAVASVLPAHGTLILLVRWSWTVRPCRVAGALRLPQRPARPEQQRYPGLFGALLENRCPPRCPACSEVAKRATLRWAVTA